MEIETQAMQGSLMASKRAYRKMARARRVPEMSSPNGGRVYSERANGQPFDHLVLRTSFGGLCQTLFVVGVVHIKTLCGLAFHEAHWASAS